jgi:hypothetical protein
MSFVLTTDAGSKIFCGGDFCTASRCPAPGSRKPITGGRPPAPPAEPASRRRRPGQHSAPDSFYDSVVAIYSFVVG